MWLSVSSLENIEPYIRGSIQDEQNTQSNLAIFMVIFMVCAMEVVFVKIVTAITEEFGTGVESESEDSLNNNHEIPYMERSSVARWFDMED